MRLVKLEVTNWRGLQSKVIEFSDKVTVVGGPNECGKSSLRAALRAALLLPTGARGEKKVIEANRPWDTRLFPSVKLELVIDDKTCVVEKEFLRSKDWASLRVNGKLIAQDEEVQPKLLDLLGPTAEWIDALWGTQGDARLDCPAPESVKGRLAAAARDTVMPQVTELEQLIDDEYQKYWTAKRGQPNKKLQDIRDATTQMETRVLQIKEHIRAADQQSAEIEMKAKEVENAKTRLQDLEGQWKSGQSSLSQWETFARMEMEAVEASKGAARCEQWLKSWEDCFKQIPSLLKQSIDWTALVDSLKIEVEAVPSRNQIDSLLARQKYLHLSIGADRYRQVTSIQVPTTPELVRLKQQHQTLTEIKARLSTGAVRATLTAEKALDVVLSADGTTAQPVSLSSGGEHQWTAEDRFELQLPGVARLQVESGNPSIRQDISKRSEIEHEIEQALQKWKATTVEELQERTSKKEIELKQVRKVEDEELKKSAALLGESDGGLSALSIEDRERLANQLTEEIVRAEQEFKEAQEKYQVRLEEYHQLIAKNPVSELDLQMRLLREYIATLPFDVESNFLVPDQPTQEWLEIAQRPVQSWKAALKTIAEAAAELQKKLVRPEGEPVTKEKLDQLERELDVIREKIKLTEAVINQAIGIIAGQGDLFARLVEAEEDLAKAESTEQRENVNAMAVRDLFLAFEDARKKLQKDVVAPLADSVTKCFSDLTDGFYDRVVFDGSLKLSGLATQTIDAISLDDISFGTREQLLLLTRLCLAELLSQSGAKQVVILDDNLVHTDNSRMEFACELLEEKASSVQVIVFTCHPERYSSIGGCRELIMA